MASYRAIMTNLFTDDHFGELGYFARLLWIGLNLAADDQGRISGSPAVVRSAVFPFDDLSLAEINDSLKKFAEFGWVILYEDDGRRLLQIVTWWRDHKTLQWAYPSRYQAPPGWMDRLRYLKNRQLVTENWDSDKSILPVKPDQLDNLPDTSTQHVQPDAPANALEVEVEVEEENKDEVEVEEEVDLWQDAGGNDKLLAALVADTHILNTRTIQNESIEAMESIGVNHQVIKEVLDTNISNVEIVGHVLWAKDESKRPNAGGLFTTRIRDRRQYQLPDQYILTRCRACLRLQCACPPVTFVNYVNQYQEETE